MIDIANDDDAARASLLESPNPADGVASSSPKSILFFWADWHPPSSPGGAFDAAARALAARGDPSGAAARFYRVSAEGAPRLSRRVSENIIVLRGRDIICSFVATLERCAKSDPPPPPPPSHPCFFALHPPPPPSPQHDVSAVPTFLFLDSDGSIVHRIDGGEDVAAVARGYSRLLGGGGSASAAVPTSSSSESSRRSPRVEKKVESSSSPSAAASPPPPTIEERLKLLLSRQRVMLFMKGVPSAPRCGFSRQIVEILDSLDAKYGTFDILQDEEVRQGLKEYSDWPTYPQLYVDGELIGGLDIVKEMVEDGELGGLLVGDPRSSESTTRPPVEKEKEATKPTIEERLKLLLNQQRVMLFLKGVPSAPRCGFSRQIVEMLDSIDASYGAFDILQDEEVRQGLKEYSDWPTYPQLYVDGELVGGLDIVKEMVEDGELEGLLKG